MLIRAIIWPQTAAHSHVCCRDCCIPPRCPPLLACAGTSSGATRQSLSLQGQGSQQQVAALGLSPETASFWGDSWDASHTWWEGEERQLASYSRSCPQSDNRSI